MNKKNTSTNASPTPETNDESLLGSVAHTLGDAMAGAVGAAADTVTEFVREELPLKEEPAPKKKKTQKRSRPKAKAKAKVKAKRKSKITAKAAKRAAPKAAKRTARASAKPKRKTARKAKQTRRSK